MVELTRWSDFSVQKMTELLFDLVIITWGPFLETPDILSIFSSSFIYQLMVIIGANLAIYASRNCKD